ncbi:S8 family serine peptidase [Catellatospora bangladeshensis]|uniref:Type VII secretion-associated serine protease n=1 Tax=Catellatospora bangladeshensis TaxID=310355 RepID=A0A8J3NLB8_9ACTN|nr:S8 family serine peptidase [Catellatospora bangladeshensis]GIF85330.1 type VII secretion-associated serine protease [Catellatospora bangladeshensis]
MSPLATVRLTTIALVMTAVLLGAANGAIATDDVSDGQWFHSFLSTDKANKITDGAGVTVAVIDSGVDASHPDLRGSVRPGIDLAEGGHGDGRTDEDGHGTAMAGLIAAHGRVRGIAPGAAIVPVKVSPHRQMTAADIVEGIQWAISQKVDVISISLADDFDDPALRQAVAQALKSDIVVVAGAGNKPDPTVGFPAAIPGVVAVGGVDRQGDHAKISVTGAAIVVCAPSDEITSTGLQHLWRKATGTSDSTAIVAGAAALVRARYPDLSAAEVVHRITATAIDKGPAGRDPQYGYGVLDIVAALTADVPPLASASPSTPAEPDSNNPWPLVIIIGTVVVAGVLVLLLVVRSRRRG